MARSHFRRFMFAASMARATGSSFDSDAQAYFTATGLTDATYTTPINQFVLDLKAASLWTKLDRLWLLANKDETAALTCIKSLNAASPINIPTFTAGQGYAGNGTTSYVDLGFLPSIDGVNFLQDSASMFFYSRSTGGSGRDMGSQSVAGGNSTQLIANFGDNTAYCTVNAALTTFTTAANANASGLHMASRTGASALALYKSGVSIATGTTSSTGLSNQSWFLGGFQTSSATLLGPTTRQHALAGGGGGFNDTEAAAFNTCVATLKASIGF